MGISVLLSYLAAHHQQLPELKQVCLIVNLSVFLYNFNYIQPVCRNILTLVQSDIYWLQILELRGNNTDYFK